MKKTLCGLSMIALSFTVQAQIDSLSYNPSKRIVQSIGLQANPLIREILNLSSTPSTNANPFLLKYTIRKTDSKWEFQTGIGYTYNKIVDQDDRETRFNEGALRVGLQRKYSVNKRFEAGFGVDFIGKLSKRQTFNENIFEDSEQTITTRSVATTNTTAYGSGYQLNLTYAITKNLLIGTEATGYFTKSAQKSNVTITQINEIKSPNEVITSTEVTNDDDKLSDFSISLPVVLFVSIRF